MNIAADIKEYHEKYDCLTPMLRAFRRLPKIELAIHHATIGLWLGIEKKPNGEFYIHPHQAQISLARRRACRDALMAVRGELPKYKNFEELRAFIADTIPSKRKDGVAIYDMALRLGAFLRVRPEFVYLHAGVKRGAKRFGITGKRMVRVEELPKAFHNETPWAVEDILCQYYK
jgi:hypothetical protein